MSDDICPVCFGVMSFPHDHKSDNSGLDDGPFIRPQRKKQAPKAAAELKQIRHRAWQTRRERYGQHGHR